MDPPECPVCLQPYDSDAVVPRVLSCGHTACEACLARLPHQFAATVRCPACTQVVPLSRPSALPKNIELLRLVEAQYPSANASCRKESRPVTAAIRAPPEFIQWPWTSEFCAAWKDHVLPSDAVALEDGDEHVDWCDLRFGRLVVSSHLSNSFRLNQKVSLLPVANSNCKESEFVPSYSARVIEALHLMKGEDRDKLSLVIRAASKHLRLCKIYGLWLNLEDGSLFLVSERYEGDFSEILGKLIYGGEGLGPAFAMAGLEISEAVMSLHSAGLVSGFFIPSYFRFDDYGHLFLDMNEIVVAGRRVQTKTVTGDSAFSGLVKMQAFVGPELQVLLRDKCNSEEFYKIIGHESDVWSLAFMFIRVLVGNEDDEEGLKPLCSFLPIKTEENDEVFIGQYKAWVDKSIVLLGSLLGTEFEQLQAIFSQCLDWDPACRPPLIDVWKCFRGYLVKPHVDILLAHNAPDFQEKFVCLSLESLRSFDITKNGTDDVCKMDLSGSTGQVNGGISYGFQEGSLRSLTIEGHSDCITGLAIGGGFLFSSSFDKRVHMWSLLDFSFVKSLRGHEHRVMAVVVVDAEEPLCISGDSGGLIFVWGVGASHGSEPLQMWNEHSEWRYSGVHSLVVSGTEFLYSGSGDKSIKAWSMKDYTLAATMTGHKSVVSSLAVCGGILYSGSWDGTVRLWWLNDHSPLSVLGEDIPGSISSVLSISVDSQMLVASHENGCVKIWKNDMLVKSIQTHESAIISVAIIGKFLFMGGWNGKIDVQELEENELGVHTKSLGSICCDAVITALSYWQGKLIVGFSNKGIKVYSFDCWNEN